MSIVNEDKSMEAEELAEVLPERSHAKGLHVFLAGRPREKLDAVARDIEGGGSATVRYSTRSTIKLFTSIPASWSHPGDTSVLTNLGKCKNTCHGSCHQGGIRLEDKENDQ